MARKEAATTVERVHQSARESHQRCQLLREMMDLLDAKYGRRADGDPDFVRAVGGGYEVPNKAVVDELRTELLAAWSRSYDKYKRLSSARVVNVDALLLGEREPLG